MAKSPPRAPPKKDQREALLPSGFTKHTTALAVVETFKDHDYSSKVALVTGANSGIGKETAIALASAGCSVWVCCRSLEKAEETIADIVSSTRCSRESLHAGVMEMSSLASVRAFAARFSGRLDILVNNAGIMQLPTYTTSADGYELQFAVNFLAPYLLTQLLVPNLQLGASAACPSRVVNVSSAAHYSCDLGTFNPSALPVSQSQYRSWNAYAESKMLQILHAQQLTEDLAHGDHPVVAYALHPGVIATGLGRNASCCSFTWWLYCCPAVALAVGWHKTTATGAAPSVRCALDPSLGNLQFSGAYISDNCQPTAPWLPANPKAAREALVARCERLLAPSAGAS